MFLAKIDWLRAAARLRQADVEESCGLAENRISKWAAGQGEPTAAQAWAIARLFHVDLLWLIDPDQPIQHPVPEYTSDERRLLDVIRRIGTEEAAKRLGGPTPSPPSVVRTSVVKRRPKAD